MLSTAYDKKNIHCIVAYSIMWPLLDIIVIINIIFPCPALKVYQKISQYTLFNAFDMFQHFHSV